MDNKAFDLMVQNLSRLDESSPEDAKVAVWCYFGAATWKAAAKDAAACIQPLLLFWASINSLSVCCSHAQGVYNTLNVLENVCEIRPSLADDLCAATSILQVAFLPALRACK